jgi:hypothetical protein
MGCFASFFHRPTLLGLEPGGVGFRIDRSDELGWIGEARIVAVDLDHRDLRRAAPRTAGDCPALLDL